MNDRNYLIRLEYRVAVSSQLPSYIYAVNGFCEQMRDAPRCHEPADFLKNILQITAFNVHVCQTSTYCNLYYYCNTITTNKLRWN